MAEEIEASHPDWIESNFASAENPTEAQARAYPEARAMGHRAMSERDQAVARAQELEQYAAQLEAEREELAAQPQAGPQYGEGLTNPLLLQLRQAREMGDDQTEMAITAFMASQIAEQKIAEALKNQPQPQQQDSQVTNEFYAYQADQLARDSFDNRYGQGEWDNVKRDAAQWLATEAPDLVPDSLSASDAAKRLVWAAEYVQGRKMLAGTEEDRNQQVQARQRRMLAQTSTGSGTPPAATETDDDRWARLKNAPVSSYTELRGQ